MRRRKILFVTPYLPSPPTFGGRARLHGLATELAERHDVSILSFVDTIAEDSGPFFKATSAYCKGVHAIPSRAMAPNGARKRALQMVSLASPFSYERLSYRSAAFQTKLDELIDFGSLDLVNIEFCQMATHDFKHCHARPRVVLDEHNIEFDVLRRTAGGERGLLRKAYNAANWRKLRFEESHAWARADGCTVTSRHDRDLLLSLCPGVPTAVVPNGVDLDRFSPAPGGGDTTASPLVLFFGSIGYYPNTDAVHWLLDEIWPKIRRSSPTARLAIVGPDPPSSILARRSDDVIVTGFVEDIHAHICRASVVIAPLRIGGGTRLKVLEAMATAKPVVATSIGVEGIDAEPGTHLLVADDPERFAESVVSLIRDPSRAAQIGSAGRALVEAHYSWRSAVNVLCDFYEEVLGRPALAA